MRDPGIFVDFDMLEQQLRAFVGQLDGLPSSSAISAAQSGTAPAAASAGVQTAIEHAETALRQRLGEVLKTLNEHADLLRRAGQELAEADAGAGTAVVALDTALDSAATAEQAADRPQNPGAGSTSDGRSKKSGL